MSAWAGAVLSALVAACVGDGPFYPEHSLKEPVETEIVDFLKGRVTEEKGPEDSVMLSFQFLPRMKYKNDFIELDTRLVFNFKALSEKNNKVENVQIGLSALSLVRLKKQQTLYTNDENTHGFEDNYKGLKFFENLEEFCIEAGFNPSEIVGYLNFDEACLETSKRNYASCLMSLRLTTNMTKVFELTNPFSEEFWEKFKAYQRGQLEMRLAKLHADFDYDHDNVLFRWLMWQLDQHDVDIYDFRMSSINGNPTWGPLNTSWLQIMPRLHRLDLNNNGITEMDPRYLSTIQHNNVTYLNLGRNRLSKFPEPILNMTKLTFLDLSGNKFVDAKIFFIKDHSTRFPLVTFLNMSGVPINETNLIENLLKANTDFTVLDFSYCGLKDYYKLPLLFSKQRQLTHLFLSGNRLVRSPHLQFDENQKLLTIDLAYNKFTTPLNMLDQGNVTYLNLTGNKILDWTGSGPNCNESVFDRIDHVNLSLNSIPVLTQVSGKSLEILQTVDLGGNPFDCENCDLPKFKKWLESYQNSSNNTNIVKITLFNEPVDDFNCTRPSKYTMFLISNVTFDESLCQFRDDWFLKKCVPSLVGSFLIVTLGVIIYVYRYEIKYFVHLVKIRRRINAKARRFENDYQFDAFVCYSASDRAWVLGDLLPALENGPQKYRLCLHERDCKLGAFIASNIVGAIQNSRHTIVVLTESFMKKQWCKWELEMASHKMFEESQEFLVLVELEWLDRNVLPRHLNDLMDTCTHLQWPELKKKSRGIDAMYKRLEEALGTSIHQAEEDSEEYSEDDSEDDSEPVEDEGPRESYKSLMETRA